MPAEERGQVRVVGQLPPRVATLAREGCKVVETYTHPDLLPQVKFFEANPGEIRASHRGSNIYLPPDAPTIEGTRSAAHEITHPTEQQNAEVLKAAKAFLEKRTAGETPKRLRDLTGDPSYKPDEMALVDKWKELGGSHYCGKIMPDATELLTMGIARLHKDPARFAREDPEVILLCGKNPAKMVRRTYGC